jgi:hypothetical protein
MATVNPPTAQARRVASRPASLRSPILTETSWSPRRELTIDDWLRQCRCLGSVARASGWWIGDWSRYGSPRYGEKYDAAARITGYDVQSLMNMPYVASRFKFSRRREKLSFSHHAELAALTPDEQERWLDRAEREGLSVRALRDGLRRSARSPQRLGPSQAVLGADDVRRSGRDAEVVCPQCGHHFRPEPATERDRARMDSRPGAPGPGGRPP